MGSGFLELDHTAIHLGLVVCVMGGLVFVASAVHSGCSRSGVTLMDPSVLQVTVDAVSAEAGRSGISLPT